jgi:superfamily II DNA/RNA helicase
VVVLHKSLVRHGFSAGALHGDMDQYARMASLDAFKTGEVNLLVCSDVAARGLDIPDVSHVFNFDVPIHSEDYVHRIGRTGRAGKTGIAITLVTGDDKLHVSGIESLIQRKIAWMAAPPAETGPLPERSGRSRSDRHRDFRQSNRNGHLQNGQRPPDYASDEAAVPAHASRRPVPPRDNRVVRPTHNPDRKHRRDDDPPVIGLGDHIPSFLLRPVKLKPLKAVED